MSERENTSLPEKEKTLEEKVGKARTILAMEMADIEEARQAGVYQRTDDYDTDIYNTTIIEEALTALEERVEELEKEREFGNAVSKIVSGTHNLSPEDEKALHEYYENKYNKEDSHAPED